MIPFKEYAFLAYIMLAYTAGCIRSAHRPVKLVMIAMLALILILLAGCSTTTASDRALIVAGQSAATLPAMSDSELTCTDEPAAPSPKGTARVRESQTQNYILDLIDAGADCREKLGVTRRVWRKVEEVRSRAVPPVNKGESK